MSKIYQKNNYEIMCDNLYDDIIKRNINYFDNVSNEEKKVFYDKLLKDYRYFKKFAKRTNQYLNNYKYKPWKQQ